MQISREELILYLRCLNEVLRGFAVENFERRLGLSKAELTKDDARLREIEKSARNGGSIRDVHIHAVVIKATMEELGKSEFPTRTGFELREAQRLLEKLNQTFVTL
jgi:hypothetical protein